jgi:RND family efflux transporter MFP subunit
MLALTVMLMPGLTACSKAPARIEEVRPVRAMVLQSADTGADAEFSGEVRPRVESGLGFRVPGKIVSRKVDAGDVVVKGQVLMRLDPQDLQLSQAQALASLRSAETARDLARAELQRYRDLRAQNFVSQTVLDTRESTLKEAQASVDAALAAYRSQSNQTAYSALLSDVDGVVTQVAAEVGQVVAAGTVVARVAKVGEKEVVIGLPEDKVASLSRVPDVRVRLWADSSQTVPGRIREISPAADPATRTYAARVSIPDNMREARLGMTAMVTFSAKTGVPKIRVPLSALYRDRAGGGDRTAVWVIENGAVRLAPVVVEGAAGNDLLLTQGVRAGQQIVTAGVHMLQAGQKVTVLGNEALRIADGEGMAEPAVPGEPAGSAAVAGMAK